MHVSVNLSRRPGSAAPIARPSRLVQENESRSLGVARRPVPGPGTHVARELEPGGPARAPSRNELTAGRMCWPGPTLASRSSSSSRAPRSAARERQRPVRLLICHEPICPPTPDMNGAGGRVMFASGVHSSCSAALVSLVIELTRGRSCQRRRARTRKAGPVSAYLPVMSEPGKSRGSAIMTRDLRENAHEIRAHDFLGVVLIEAS